MLHSQQLGNIQCMSRHQVPPEYVATADVLQQIQSPSAVFILIVTKYQFIQCYKQAKQKNLKQITCSV